MDSLLILIPLEEQHLEWTRLLHNDPEVLKMLTDPHIVSPQEQQEWFQKLKHSKSSERLVALYNNNPIGVIRLDDIDYYNRSICVGLDIHKDYRGKGFAKPIYQQILRQWFIDKNFNRIWLLVASYNSIGIHIYSSLGFKKEGVQLERLYKDGKFFDYIMMSILKAEYMENQNDTSL